MFKKYELLSNNIKVKVFSSPYKQYNEIHVELVNSESSPVSSDQIKKFQDKLWKIGDIFNYFKPVNKEKTKFVLTEVSLYSINRLLREMISNNLINESYRWVTRNSVISNEESYYDNNDYYYRNIKNEINSNQENFLKNKITPLLNELVDKFIISEDNLKLMIKMLFKAASSDEVKKICLDELNMTQDQANILANNYKNLFIIFHGIAGLEDNYASLNGALYIPSLSLQKRIIIEKLIKKSVSKLNSDSITLDQDKQNKINDLAGKLLNRDKILMEKINKSNFSLDFFIKIIGKRCLLLIIPHINKWLGKFLNINFILLPLYSIIANFREIFLEGTLSKLEKFKIFLTDIIFALIPIIILPLISVNMLNIYILSDFMKSFKELYRDYTEKRDYSSSLKNTRFKFLSLVIILSISPFISINTIITLSGLYLLSKSVSEYYDHNSFGYNKFEKFMCCLKIGLSCVYNSLLFTFFGLLIEDILGAKTISESRTVLQDEILYDPARTFTQSLMSELRIDYEQLPEAISR